MISVGAGGRHREGAPSRRGRSLPITAGPWPAASPGRPHERSCPPGPGPAPPCAPAAPRAAAPAAPAPRPSSESRRPSVAPRQPAGPKETTGGGDADLDQWSQVAARAVNGEDGAMAASRCRRCPWPVAPKHLPAERRHLGGPASPALPADPPPQRVRRQRLPPHRSQEGGPSSRPTRRHTVGRRQL